MNDQWSLTIDHWPFTSAWKVNEDRLQPLNSATTSPYSLIPFDRNKSLNWILLPWLCFISLVRMFQIGSIRVDIHRLAEMHPTWFDHRGCLSFMYRTWQKASVLWPTRTSWNCSSWTSQLNLSYLLTLAGQHKMELFSGQGSSPCLVDHPTGTLSELKSAFVGANHLTTTWVYDHPWWRSSVHPWCQWCQLFRLGLEP